MKIISVPSQRYQDSRHLLQNPKVPRSVMGFSNRAQRFTGSNYLDVDSPFETKKSSIQVYLLPSCTLPSMTIPWQYKKGHTCQRAMLVHSNQSNKIDAKTLKIINKKAIQTSFLVQRRIFIHPNIRIKHFETFIQIN